MLVFIFSKLYFIQEKLASQLIHITRTAETTTTLVVRRVKESEMSFHIMIHRHIMFTFNEEGEMGV